MESLETLTEAVELLLDKMAAQESVIFLLARYLVDTRVVTDAELADRLRWYTMPNDTPAVVQLRRFYADVIDGGGPRLSVIEGGKDAPDKGEQPLN